MTAPVPAPAWLLARIRPRPYVRPELPPGGELREGHRYAITAVGQILTEIASMPKGGRNEGAFSRACRLHELTNAEWSGLDFEQVQAGYLLACQQADSDPAEPFTYGEAWSVWLKAQKRIGTKTADLPRAEHLGTGITFESLGLPPAAQGAAAADVPGTAALEQVSPFEAAIRRETWIIAAREEAQRRLKIARAPVWTVDILDRARQREIQKVRPLVQGWLGWGQAARIYGPPGSGKSFAACELAACVSTGRLWHGRRVAVGEVLYVAAEDPAGIALRLQAWERHAEAEHNVHMVSDELQMNIETVQRVLEALRAYFAERPIGLVVLDTQAMVTVGMDENSSQDMGLFVQAVKLMARETGACVLVVHHSGVKGGRARGSTSVLGAMDVEMEASMTGRTMTLSGTKQKNLATPLPLMATLHTVGMDEFDDFGQQLTSAVLVAAGDPGTPLVLAGAAETMRPIERRALAIATVLLETQASGETYARVRTRAAQVTDFGNTPGTVTQAFSKAWSLLVERGRIAKALGRESFYFVEINDGDRLSVNPDKKVQGGPEVYEAT